MHTQASVNLLILVSDLESHFVSEEERDFLQKQDALRDKLGDRGG